MVSSDTKFLVNPTGRFVTGGPVSDCGLTGRKIIVDTYGGMPRSHGGGAFSGKDPTKVDRSAPVTPCEIHRQERRGGGAGRALQHCRWHTPSARRDPVSVLVETRSARRFRIRRETHRGPDPANVFRPDGRRGSSSRLDLRRGDVSEQTAAYGHFGRTEPEFTWEHTDKADALRDDAGTKVA